jgi:hypothetical protein
MKENGLTDKNTKIFVATKNQMYDSYAGVNINLQKGFVYMLDEVHGNIVELRPRNVNEQERKAAIDLLKVWASNVQISGGNTFYTDAGRISTESGISVPIKQLLNDLIGFGNIDNLTTEGFKKFREIRDKIAKLKDAGQLDDIDDLRKELERLYKEETLNSREEFQINMISNEAAMELPNPITTMAINIAGTPYEFFKRDAKNNITNEINPDVVEALEKFLDNKFIQINSSTISKQDNYSRVVGVVDGKLVRKSYDSYTDFLYENALQTKQVNYSQNNTSNVEVRDSKGADTNVKTVPAFINQYVIYAEEGEAPLETPKEPDIPNEPELPEDFDLEDVESVVNAFESGELKATFMKEKEFLEKFGKKNVGGAVIKEDSLEDDSDIGGGVDAVPFRLVSSTFEDVENIDKAFEWFKERFPNKIKKVDKLIKGKGWGAFIKGVVYIYENAEIGTTYHEAFHVAFDTMLTKAEQKALLDEVKNNPLLKDKISAQKALYKDKSEDSIIEEVLAEEFRSWKLNNGRSDLNQYKGIAGFFKKFLDFIRGLITFNQLINPTAIDIFNRIENGVYAEQKIGESSAEKFRKKDKNPLKFNYNTENKYFNSSEYIGYIMNGVSVGFLQYFFVNKKAKGGISLLTKDMVNQKDVTAAYALAKQVLIGYRDKATDKTIRKNLRFAIENWDETVEIHKQHLKQLSLEFTSYSDIFEEVDENQRDNLKGQSFDAQAIQRSSKESASTATRLIVATLRDGTAVNEFGIPKFVNFGKTFSLLSNKLVGTKSPEDVAIAIGNLEMEYDFIKSLMGRLNIIKSEAGSLFAPNSMNTPDEVMNVLKFTQTFAKSFANFQVGLINEDGKMTIMDATKAQSRNNVINHIWLNKFDIERRANENNYTSDGDYVRDNFDIKDAKYYEVHKNAVFDFLKSLGIVFTNQDAIIENIEHYRTVRENAIWLAMKIKNSKETFVPNFFNKEVDSNEYNRIQELIDIEVETNSNYFENSVRSFDGKRIYSNILYSYMTYIMDEYNNIKTQEDLNRIMPHLQDDDYSKSSLIKERMLKDENFSMEYIVLDGFREQKTFSGEEYKDNTKAERLQSKFVAFQKYNAFGYFRPADNKLERFVKFNKAFFSKDNTEDNLHINKMFDYLYDELNTIINKRDVPNANYTSNYGRGIILDIIQEANPDLYRTILDKTKDSKTLFEFLEKKNDTIRSLFVKFHQDRLNNMYDVLEENGLVFIKNGKLEFNNLNNTTDIQVLVSELNNWLINDFVFRIEMTKMVTGNPVFYKHPLDFYKRMSGTVGNKKLAFVDNFTNDFIDQNGEVYNLLVDHHNATVDTSISNTQVSKTLKDDNDNVLLRYAILNDPIFYTEYFDKFLTTGLDKYHKMTKADGLGIITLDAWRQFMIRNADWGYGEKSLEEFYQWELQIDMGIPEENRVYIDPKNPKEIRPILKKNVQKVANSIKPQSFGPHANKNMLIPAFEKLSFQIALPSLYTQEEFKELKSLKEKLTRQGIGVAIFESGVKSGALHNNNGDFNSLVNNNGEFNDIGLDSIDYVDTYYKYWGIQVDTGNTVHETSPTGVQVVRHIMNMIFDSGIARKRDGNTTDPIDNNLVQAVKEFIEVNGSRIDIGMKILLDKLQVEKVGNFYAIKEDKKEELIRLLQDEAIKRDLSKDTVIAIENAFKNNLGIDVLTNREHLENVLFAIADKNTITQKTFGAGKYQVASPVTGFIKDVDGNDVKVQYALIDRKTKKFVKIVDSVTPEMKEEYDVRYTTPSNFYKKDPNGGQTKRMVAYITNPFDDSVDLNNLPEELKRIIGYRIPTQTPNSIESIEVKFLPKGVGDIIILPTEIVAKAGSDYDIDKLYTFFNNFYYNSKGQPVYINPNNVEEQYSIYLEEQAFIRKNKILSKLANISNPKARKVIQERIKRINANILSDKTKTFDEKYANALDIANEFEEIKKIGLSIKDGLEDADKQRIEDFLTILGFEDQVYSVEDIAMSFDQFKLKAVENRFRELMDYIILHPDNFENLTTPISNDAFTEIKELLLEPKLKFEKNDKFSNLALLEVEDGIYENFMEGVDTIGIAAITNTFNVLAQVYDLRIPTKITSFRNYVNSADNKTSETRINLDSNQKEDGSIPLGRYMSAENTSELTEKHQREYGKLFEPLKIPMVLSQWTNAAVDNAKELIMLAFNSGKDNLGISLYLTMAGVPLAQIGIFMNQPIIKEFTKRKKMSNGLLSKATGIDQSDRDIAIDMIREINPDVVTDFEKWFNNKKADTTKLDVSKMINNLGTDWNTKEQLKYFYEFLRHKDTASVITNTIQKISYDNKSIGKNSSELISKIAGTQLLQKNPEIINIDKLLVSSPTQKGFMQEYYDAAQEIYKIYTDNFSHISKLADDLIKRKSIEFEQRRMPADVRYKILQKMKNDYLLKLITDTEFNGKMIIEHADRLFNPNNGLYSDLLAFQSIIKDGLSGKPFVRDKKYTSEEKYQIFNKIQNNSIIKNLSRSSSESVKNRIHMKLHFDESQGYESEQIREDWEALINSTNKYLRAFGQDLALFALLQGGYNNSPINFRQFIPESFNNMLLKKVSDSVKDITMSKEAKAIYDRIFEVSFAIINNDISEIVPNTKSRKVSEFKKDKKVLKKYENLSYEARLELIKKRVKVYSSKLTFKVFKVEKGNITKDSKPFELPGDNYADLGNGSSLKAYNSKELNGILKEIFTFTNESAALERIKYNCKFN